MYKDLQEIRVNLSYNEWLTLRDYLANTTVKDLLPLKAIEAKTFYSAFKEIDLTVKDIQKEF